MSGMTTFIQYGKTHQLRLEHAEDLAALLTLDDALWVATSAPVSVFRCDAKFTTLLVDGDRSTRITSDEVRQAVRWLLSVLADRGRLAEGAADLALASIRADSQEGQALVQSARYVLKTLGTPEAASISLEQVRRFLADLNRQPLNGDRIVVPESTGQAELAAFIADGIACMGGIDDASGKPGLDEARINGFMNAVREYLAWRREEGAGADRAAMLPLGDATPAGYRLLGQHAGRVDLFFELCKALQYDSDIAGRIGQPETFIKDADIAERAGLEDYLRRAPLAEPNAGLTLPLVPERLNPFYRDWLEALRADVLKVLVPNLGDTLTYMQWRRVKAAFQPYADYLARKQGGFVETLPAEKLQAYRDGRMQQEAHALLARDQAVAAIRKGALELERLLLYHQNLMRLVNNFVSFSQLYNVRERALFEMGSLVIDGRWFNLALKVDDVAAHAAIAKTSSMFTMYVDVQRTTGEPVFRVAVPATSGSKGNLVVGKRGVFFDTDGREYDAKVTQIIENPISLPEALAAPFVNLWKFVLGKIEAMSSASEQELAKTADKLMAGPPPTAQPRPAGGPSALLVSMSLSVAAIGSAFAFIAKTVTAMSPAQVALGLAGGIAVIMFPITLTACIKLSRRDVSSLLEGCGWAINARMRLNGAQRRQFTQAPPYPEGAMGVPRRGRWGLFVTIALILLLLATSQCRSRRPDDPTPRAVGTPAAELNAADAAAPQPQP